MKIQMKQEEIPEHLRKFFKPVPGLKPKDLLMIPARVALALQTDGWYLRSAAPWVKRAAMPESVTDRPASALEYIFLLARSERYFFDMEAVRVADTGYFRAKANQYEKYSPPGQLKQHDGLHRSSPAGRSRRNSDFWFESVGMLLSGDGEILGYDVNPQSYRGAHFATFPEKLVTPMVLSGSSERGVCPRCFSPWLRVVEQCSMENHNKSAKRADTPGAVLSMSSVFRTGKIQKGRTTGWQPSCTCYGVPPLPDYPDDSPDPAEVERIRARRLELLALYVTLPATPSIILDPFAGSGTTLAVAVRLGRRGLGIELNREYMALIQERVGQAERGQEMPLFQEQGAYETPGLFDGGEP